MKFEVILDFDIDIPEDNLEEFTASAKQCLEEGAEYFHADVKVHKIVPIEVSDEE